MAMPDRRVIHFWDGELQVGQWFAKQVDGYDGTSWDIYYLYGPDALWETVPAPLVASGSTIYRERQALMMQVSTVLGKGFDSARDLLYTNYSCLRISDRRNNSA
jgi:hypothetical protein